MCGSATASSQRYIHTYIQTQTPHKHTKRQTPDVAHAGQEWQWNDFADVDVRGKVLLLLPNDPGFRSGDPDLFRGRALTYPGRGTYKYEEASRRGAAGVLIVHETDAAGYPWSVVVAGRCGA